MRTFAVLIIGIVVSLWLTPLVRRLALHFGVVDIPGGRKIHSQPTPRLGGIAVCLAWVCGLAVALVFPEGSRMSWQLLPVAILGMITVAFGVLDDWWDVRGTYKLAVQAIIGSLLFAVGPRIDRLTHPFGGEILLPDFVAFILTTLWIIGMMNAINLIDGSDGLACGVVATAAFGLILSGLYVGSYTSVVVLAALAGACIGFLRYNFPPASVFLGDSGSQFLGFALGAAALISDQYKVATVAALLVPLTVVALPIYDTALAIVRRYHQKRSLFHADSYHIHHRLLNMGLSQKRIAVFCYLLTLYLSCLAFLFVLIPERYALILLFLLGLGMFMAIQTLRFIEVRLAQRTQRSRRARRNK